MRPPGKLLRAMLAKVSATAAHQTLTAQGYTISRSQCEVLRPILIANGEAQPIASTGGDALFPSIADPADGAEMASRNLLRAHLRTGQHWITDPVQFARACEIAGLAA